MPRPLRPDGRLQVRLFVTGKYRYAATQATTRDPETGRYVPRKTIYGTVSYDLAFTPNARYLSLCAAQKDSLHFLPGEDACGRGACTAGQAFLYGRMPELLYGNTPFPGGGCPLRRPHLGPGKGGGGQAVRGRGPDAGAVSIISLSATTTSPRTRPSRSSPATEGSTAGRSRASPGHTAAPPGLLRPAVLARLQSQWIGIDSTSYSSYGSHTADLRRGRNKEGDDLRQINELVVYGLESRLLSITASFRQHGGSVTLS